MGGSMEDLARMLGRLREETPEVEPRPLPQSAPPPAQPRAFIPPAPGVTGRSRRTFAEPSAAPEPVHHGSLIWAENKETLIFGLLISVLASALGVIGGYPYLVLFGSVAFMLFAIASFLMLVGYYFNSRRRGSTEFGVQEKIDRLSRKIAALEMRPSTPGASGPAMDAAREKELERKVEELRAIVRSLSKAVESPGGR